LKPRSPHQEEQEAEYFANLLVRRKRYLACDLDPRGRGATKDVSSVSQVRG
jgi:hypothetical protein